MRRPSLKSPCVADRYAGPRERIAEFLTPAGHGGLIRIQEHDDESVTVEVYRTDGAPVRVIGPTAA